MTRFQQKTHQKRETLHRESISLESHYTVSSRLLNQVYFHWQSRMPSLDWNHDLVGPQGRQSPWRIIPRQQVIANHLIPIPL